jgi:hypothetical protein
VIRRFHAATRRCGEKAVAIDRGALTETCRVHLPAASAARLGVSAQTGAGAFIAVSCLLVKQLGDRAPAYRVVTGSTIIGEVEPHDRGNLRILLSPRANCIISGVRGTVPRAAQSQSKMFRPRAEHAQCQNAIRIRSAPALHSRLGTVAFAWAVTGDAPFSIPPPRVAQYTGSQQRLRRVATGAPGSFVGDCAVTPRHTEPVRPGGT